MASIFHSRNFAFLTLFSFLMLGVFCLWNTHTMNMDDSSDGCVMCGTDARHHISAWQNFLSVIPQKIFELLPLILLFVFASATYKNIWSRAPKVVRSLATRSYAMLDILDPLKWALARGIIP